MIQQKSEIKAGLESSFQKMVQFIESLDKHDFEDNPNGKWSAGQQLEHLIKSVKPLNLVFLLPKFVLPIMFGKMKRTGRSYEELLDKYHEKLKKGGQASSPFVPAVIKFEERAQKLIKFKNHLSKLLRHLDSMNDRQLDTLILPHPLLGKVSLREMMFFTIFHTEHHLNLLKAK